MKINFPSLIKYFFFLALGVFFVWLSVKGINHEKWLQIKAAVTQGRKWVIDGTTRLQTFNF